MRRSRTTDLVLPIVVFVVPLLAVPERLLHPGPWIGLVAAMLILFTQPSLTPKEMVKATGADRRSALGIYAGMVLPQLVAVVHYGYRSAWEPKVFSLAVVFGAAITTVGLILRISAIRTLGRFFTSTVHVESDQTVIQSGPYRWMRHPSYTGALLIALGVTMSLWSWIGMLLVGMVAIPAYVHRIRAEEVALTASLGEPYREYCQHTRRLVPFVY